MTRTIVKKYNAEIHSQSAIEGTLELKHERQFAGADVEDGAHRRADGERRVQGPDRFDGQPRLIRRQL